MKYSNVFYIAHFNVIGGIETYMYELVKKYKNEDIVVVYSAESSDRKQLNRIRKYAKVIKLSKDMKIKCKRLFIMYKSDLSNFEADDVIQIIHADYKKQKLLPNHDERITQRFGVSKVVAKAYEELSGLKTEVCYNPLTIEKPKRVLKLISATRLTKEKGLDRMKKLAEELDKKEIPYLWLVFTNQTDLMNNPNVAYMKPRLDIRNYIADADYLVQLSDTEAWAYSVVESLCLNTPVIVTPVPCFKEMGIKDGVNGYMLPFDMKNIPVEEIYNNIPKGFKFKQPDDLYDKLLIKGKKNYNPGEKIKVRAIKNYYDNEEEEHKTKESDPWMVYQYRYEELVNHPRCALVERVDE
jgi:glycosyltransferase involved in cell wall biosynthesis